VPQANLGLIDPIPLGLAASAEQPCKVANKHNHVTTLGLAQGLKAGMKWAVGPQNTNQRTAKNCQIIFRRDQEL